MSAPALAPVTPTVALPAIDAGRCRARTVPARASRIGTAPRPRVRPLGDVLAELVRPAPPTAVHTVVAPDAPVDPPTGGVAHDDPADRARVVRLLQAVVEVLDGVRPATHLRRVCDDRVHPGAVLAHVVPLDARRGRSRLRGVRVCAVAAGAGEAAGVVHRGRRARALVARLEHDGSTWRFTVLTIL